MLSHSVYNVAHIVGIIMIMAALGALALHAMNGGTRDSNRAHGLIAGLHGLGAFLVLLGGFGMLARIGFEHGSPFPGWLVVKIVIWLVLAGSVIVPYRRSMLGKPLLLVLPILGGLAAYMAVYKPF